MNDKIWIIHCITEDETITCELCGVSQDGSLLCFVMVNEGEGLGLAPKVIRGYAPGEWKRFYMSTLRSN